MSSKRHMKYVTAVLVISLQLTTSVPAKTRPVIEVINEQARIDENIRPQNFLPYSNPLAGNSQQNARLHAQNQQAMFNAERIRQHRAQLQRWTKAPQQVDSYMKAYHESQENHHLALEQQHATTREIKPVTISPKLRQAPQVIRTPKVQKTDIQKITKADAIVKPERIRSRENKSGGRNHRSYGSVEYHQHLQPKRYQTVYLSPGPTYDQGVTIKPNGNVGLASLKNTHVQEETKLFTSAIPSKTQYIYPKQYGQMQHYQSAYDIDTLNSILKKNPTEQLTELNALLKHQVEPTKDTLTTPIDLFFYLKDTPSAFEDHYGQANYASLSPSYASAYSHETKDHIPIKEDVEDIEDPNKDRPNIYTAQPTVAPEEHYTVETTTSKTKNYYKVEVASQTISAPYNPKASYYYKEQEKPSYQVVQHHNPYKSYHSDHKLEGDHSERYLHHNAQHTGIQHLLEDGTGTSAYGDEVSIDHSVNTKDSNVRKRRSSIETDPFYVPEKVPVTESPILTTPQTVINVNNTPQAESLIRLKNFQHPRHELSTFLTTPNFPIGVAHDYPGGEEYEDSFKPIRPRPGSNKDKFDIYDEDEGDYDEDDYESDYDSRPNNRFKQRPSLYEDRPFQNYAPSSKYTNTDLTGSFTKKFRRFNNGGYGQNFNSFSQDFGYPQYSEQNTYGAQDSYPPYPPADVQNFAEPPVYGPPKPQYGPPKPIVPVQYGPPIQNPHTIIEPVYMLTQSQLKELIGDHNTNIQHYDIYQLPNPKKKPSHPQYPRKHKKRPRGGNRNRYKNFKKHLGRLHKFRG